jgi:vacuolar-type H+-ATPase subunit F/Vma7
MTGIYTKVRNCILQIIEVPSKGSYEGQSEGDEIREVIARYIRIKIIERYVS